VCRAASFASLESRTGLLQLRLQLFADEGQAATGCLAHLSKLFVLDGLIAKLRVRLAANRLFAAER
jgi:hypothetical protein